MRKLILSFVLAALVVACFLPGQAAAQSQFGSVGGRVTDPNGGTVPGTKVTLTNAATNTKQETTTNDDGLYFISNVAAGNYAIAIEKQGFRRVSQKFTVAVSEAVTLNYTLEIGEITQVVEVTEATITINTTSGELSREVSSKELENLPMLTRNPYALVALAPGAADTGSVTGDTRGVGISISGARTSAVNFMLDGGENNDTFVAGVGQTIPLDAVQEFKIQSNNMTAEFGRNAAVANVITKSGTNQLHGTLSEFYRGSALSTTPFDDNASGTPKSKFVRNQFGATGGGALIKDKLFYFGSFEGVRVRSSGTARFLVPTANFTANASSDTNAFLNAFGGLPTSSCPDLALTAEQIVVDIEGAPTYTGNELRNSNTLAIIPGATQLFCRTTLTAPIDAGGGAAQNTWRATGRIDHHFSQNTALFARYAFEQSIFPDGSTSLSPYQGFNTGTRTRNQNVNATLTHAFSSQLYSETRAIYNRVNTFQPLGAAPATTPCWNYDFNFNTPTGDQIVFPGYVPNVCVFAGIPFGGPQNIYQAFQGFSYVRGKHTFKWGGSFLQLRDNRTFGAYENAFFDTFDMQGMLDGRVDFVFAAIDPKGKTVGDVYNTAVDGPFTFPSFTRHYHYNEMAYYVQDTIKITPRITITAGLRWEYFGVHHSPDNERFLDANLYLNAVGSVPPLVGSKTVFEEVRDARFQRTSQFYRQDWNNYAPRIGLAWDIFGNGRTVFRGGFGLFYDRNFGNAVFNAIQNPPNYAVVSLGTSAPIKPNQFDTLGSGGASLTLSSSARMLDNDLRTAYSEQWNATIEHNLFGKGIFASVSYVGNNGIKLYSLNNLNQRGACLLLVEAVPGSSCDPSARARSGRLSRINQTGLTGMNRRGNEGLSRYHGMSLEVRTNKLANTGLSFASTYTWAHSIDNESSFFADSPFEAFFGFGFRDPYNPSMDRASSTNDIRHRGTFSGTWELPWWRGQAGFAGHAFGGWSMSGIFVAQTGGAFTVYDNSGVINPANGDSSQCGNSGTNFCFPLLTGAVPAMTQTPDTSTPNSFALYNLGGAFQTQKQFCQANSLSSPLGPFGGPGSTATSQIACTAVLSNLNANMLSPRNLFRTPGIWNVDFAILKDFKMPWEGHKLQFRSEFYNLFNHANMYVRAGTNQFSGSSTDSVTGAKGLPPGGGKERRNIQLALKYIF